jgi:hypothetical protein
LLSNEYGDTQAGAKIPQLKASVYVESGSALAADGRYAEALQEFDSAAEISQDAAILSTIEEARGDAALALAQDTGPQGSAILAEALAGACLGDGVDSPALGILGIPGRALYNSELFTLPPDLTADSPGQLKYVLCVEPSQREVQHCGLYRPGSAKLTLHLIQTSWQAWAIDPRTGVSKHTRVFMGPSPGNCPRSWSAETGGDINVVADAPSEDLIIDWLRGLLG